MSEPRLAPWQLWLVDVGNPVGHEEGGVRPAVVVGSATHCRFPIGVAVVVPLTTRDRGLAHHVRIDSPESGLTRPSWARTEDLTAVATQRFRRGAATRRGVGRRGRAAVRMAAGDGRLSRPDRRS